jgi:hypothetical protein
MEQVLLSPGDVEDNRRGSNGARWTGQGRETVTKAVHRLPIIERAQIAGGWAGLRPLTPEITCHHRDRRPASRDSFSPSVSAATVSSTRL